MTGREWWLLDGHDVLLVILEGHFEIGLACFEIQHLTIFLFINTQSTLGYFDINCFHQIKIENFLKFASDIIKFNYFKSFFNWQKTDINSKFK